MEQREVILIDTSSWIEALRNNGRTDIRERVRMMLINGLAVWCDMVAIELWNGAKGDYEKRKLTELENVITSLPMTKEVWNFARELTKKCRSAGVSVPAADLIITSCALFYNIGIEHCDKHIGKILEIFKCGHETLGGHISNCKK
ncbi:MAG: PIN domain-containing protein [bacterium]